MATTADSRPLQTPISPFRRWIISGRWNKAVVFLILAFFSFAMFYPFIWLLFSSFKTGADIVSLPVSLLPKKWTLGAYLMVMDPTRANLPIAYVNSIIVTTGTVISVLITSSMGGFIFARLEFPGRDYLFYFVLSTTMVPFLTLLIPLYIVMRELNLLNSLWGVWVPSIFSSFGVFLCRQFVYGIPRELYDAAKIDGSGDFGIYRNIILPSPNPSSPPSPSSSSSAPSTPTSGPSSSSTKKKSSPSPSSSPAWPTASAAPTTRPSWPAPSSSPSPHSSSSSSSRKTSSAASPSPASKANPHTPLPYPDH